MPTTNFEPQKPKLTYLPVKQIAIYNAIALVSGLDCPRVWFEDSRGPREITVVCSLKIRVSSARIDYSSVARGGGGDYSPPHWHVDQNAE